MGFVPVETPAPILTSANIVPENTLGNLVPDQRLPSNKTLDIMHLPDNQLSIENLKISTPINPKLLANFLKGYDADLASFLTTGFTFGFKIPYQGPRSFRLSKNLSSINGKESILHQRISKELKSKHIAGPFEFPPFPNIQVSPLGLVPKKTPGEFRLIHHLSFPEGSSINHYIPQQFCTVQYQSIDTAISIIQRLGKGTLLAKTDLENAYKQIPIHPDDFELLGFMIDKKYYFDKTLPFGLSYSCNLFEKFSTALQWILETKFSVQHCVHLLDDFLFLGPPQSSSCYSSLMAFYILAKDIGLPINASKTVYPSTTLTFLGLELDTVLFEIRLPQDKLIRLKQQLAKLQNRRSVTLLELQSLIGLLNFACNVVPPGRTFLRRLTNLTIGLSKPYHHTRLNLEARADLKAWQIFLDNFNGKALFVSNITYTPSSLHFFTDASNAGFGCVYRTKWFFGAFAPEWLEYHISVREFLPIVLALEIWGSSLKNCTVILHSDNMAVVQVINKNTSKDSCLMKLMRRLMILSLSHNVHFIAEHIPGKSNKAADLLSRLQVDEFKAQFPFMDNEPTQVPQELVHL